MADWMLAAEGYLGLSRRDAQSSNLALDFKPPLQLVFQLWTQCRDPQRPSASPPPHGTGPRHDGQQSQLCQHLYAAHSPSTPELINKTSGVLLAPGTALSPGAQSCSFSVSPRCPSSLLFPGGEQDVD